MSNTVINVVVAKPVTVKVSTNATAGIIQTTQPVTLKNTPTVPSGVRVINDLVDVTIANPANNDVLAYENGIWINSNSAGGSVAYVNAIAQANIYANNAYNNAISFASNASNINTGTLSATLLPNSGVSANTYGNASSIPVITVDATGRITNVNLSSVAGVNSFTYQSNNNTLSLSTGSGAYYNVAITVMNILNVTSNLTIGNASVNSTINSTSYSGTANNTLYVGSIAAVNVVSNAQLQSNLANYQTTAGLNANIASYLPNYTGTVNANYITAASATFTGNVSVSSLIVTGNVEVIGANNLSVTDNMIYLNYNATYTNPDIGFAANYNDGTYHHTGFFRDHASGTWKVFDNYLPEPDANIYIDQTNSTFHIANFQANTVYIGNTSVYATVNTTNFTGTSNNTLYVGTVTAVNVVSNSQLQANIQYFVNTSQLSSNLSNYSNTTQMTSNVTTAYSNAVNYVTSQSYANTLQVTSNATTAYSNAITQANIYANNAYTNALAQANIYANNAYNNAISYSGNAASAYANAVTYVGAQSFVNTSQLSSNLSNYQTTTGLAANVATLTANNTSFVGLVSAANVVSNTQLQSNLANYDSLGAAATAYTNAIAYVSPITKLSLVGF